MPSTPSPILARELQHAITEAVRQSVESALRGANPQQPRSCAPLPEFYSIRESMAVLATSRSELYRLVKARELTIIKRGRRSFLSVADVLAYAEKLRSASRSGAART